MKGTINIIGEIGLDVKLIDVQNQFDSQPKASVFNVNINSEGGCLFTGLDIYEYLMGREEEVNTNGIGVVASVASIVFMAGKNRRVNYSTRFIIHLPYISELVNMNSKQLNEMASYLEKLDLVVAGLYMQRAKVKRAEVFSMLENEATLPINQLFELGFITEQPLKVSAKLTINNHEKMSKKQTKGFMNKLRQFLVDNDVSVKNKILFTASRDEVEFPNLEDEDIVTVGDDVRLDGTTPADETKIVLADGRTLVVMAGKVSEIIESQVDNEIEGDVAEDDAEEAIEILEIALVEVKEALGEVEVENKALKAEVKEKTAKLNEAILMMKKIEGVGSRVLNKSFRDVGDFKETDEKKARPFSKAINKLKY